MRTFLAVATLALAVAPAPALPATFPALPLADTVVVNGIALDPKSPPRGIAVRKDLGLLTAAAIDGRIVHRTNTRVLETRAILTPRGDYLLLFPEGEHYATAKGRPKVNTPEPNYLGRIAANLESTRRIVYQTVGALELHLDVFEPRGFTATDRRPAFVTIHGGGWTSGNPRSMYPWAKHAADLGLVGISVQYRLYKPGTDVTVFECVKDACSAVRYIRAHAAELGLDPHKLVVNGASAGGHLAAATALFDGRDQAGKTTGVSCRPDALVLFSPVIDTSAEGYGNAKIGARWRELSPAHQVRAGVPPTLTFHGTGDKTTPFKGAQLFHEAMLQAGNRSELVSVAGAQHTYMFKDATLHAETIRRLDAFLEALGFSATPPPVP